MTEINENLKHAATKGLKDLLALMPIGEEGYSLLFLQVLKNIRSMSLIQEAVLADIKRHVFERIRMDQTFFTDLMSASTSFQLELADRDAAIKHFVACARGFDQNTLVVDTQLVGRLDKGQDLTKLLQSNAWLFFMFYLSTQENMVFELLAESGRGALIKPPKPGAKR